MRLLFLLCLAPPAFAEEAWRLCLGTLVVAPHKPDGRPWDGPGAAAHQAAHVLHLAAETAEEKALVTAAPAVAEVIDGATAAPDLFLTLTPPRRTVIVTATREDTTRATWAPLCVTGTRAELAQLTVEVTDRDLSENDPVGILKLSGHLPMAARRWQVGPFGSVRALELHLEPVAQVVDLGQGLVRLAADRVERLEVLAPGRGTLLLEWTVGGRTAGLEGAHDDLLIGYTLFTPDGRVLDELGKHSAGTRRISIREGGKYAIVFNNQSWLRASAREVAYRFRFEP